VEQFKFRMRAYDAKNYLAQDFLAGILQTWGWYYSAKFPDDSRDFYWNTGIDGQFSVAQTASGLLPSAVFRVKAVGIRPSFWQPDYKVWADVGECEPGQVGAYS
jgi:hypothetical protein